MSKAEKQSQSDKIIQDPQNKSTDTRKTETNEANFGVGNYFDKKLDLRAVRTGGDQMVDIYAQLKDHSGDYRDLLTKASASRKKAKRESSR